MSALPPITWLLVAKVAAPAVKAVPEEETPFRKTRLAVVVIAVDVHEPELLTAPINVFTPVLLLREKVPDIVEGPVMVEVIPDILTLVAVPNTLNAPATFRICATLVPVI
jgi:hypothetical protein